MAYRAVPGGVLRCPWCDAMVPPAAVECPLCRFPLAHAEGHGGDAEGGNRGDGGGGQAPPRPSATAAPALVPIGPLPAAPGAGSRRLRHRNLTHGAWLLALVAVMLLASGLATLRTIRSPGARADRAAELTLVTALAHAQGHRAADDPKVDVIDAESASTVPTQVSVAGADGRWYGAVRSVSGRCFVLAGLVTSTGSTPPGTLSPDEPCTGSHAQQRLVRQLDPA